MQLDIRIIPISCRNAMICCEELGVFVHLTNLSEGAQIKALLAPRDS